MKILHLIDSGGLYGAEKMLIALCKEQILSGSEVTVLSCGEPNEPEKPLELALKENKIKIKPWRMMPGLNVSGMRDIWAWIKEQGFSVLHSHGYKFNVLIALTKAKNKNIPAISTVHGYVNTKFPKKNWFYEFADKIALARFDSIVRVNPLVKISLFFRLLYGKKIAYIENGIESDDLPEKAPSLTLKKLLIVGRLSSEKGHADLITAMSKLVKLDSELTLAIAGEGPLKPELERLVDSLNLSNHVVFLGYVADMNALYQQYDALVMPSYTEGLPITLLEAIARYIPVFATPVGAIPQVIDEEACVLMVNSPDSIVDKISSWSNLPSTKKLQVVSVNREKFDCMYTSKEMRKKYELVYAELVDM